MAETGTSKTCVWRRQARFAEAGVHWLKHGVFHSVVDLQAAINRFISEHNERPKPFVWRADPDAILAARARGFQALESTHPSDA